MVPKIVAKGRSFKGAAAYLLHDKGHAESSERVEWVETRNLASQNPEVAWRIMAATALDQGRLKEEAGIVRTGRKSSQAALHMVLSWHPDEFEDLSRDEMRRAAIGALKAIGAESRQVMLVAHNDEEHAHLHILCNRVSAEDGRMLTSSKDRLKLSKWAQAYEMERGQIYCENRVLNNERREQGEYVADADPLPYHQAEYDKLPPGDDRKEAFEALQAAQRDRDRALATIGAKQATYHRMEWEALSERLQARRYEIRAQASTEIAQAKKDIGDRFAPLRREQNEKHRNEQDRFKSSEERLVGRMANTMKAIDYVRRIRGEDVSTRLAKGFEVLSSAGARQDALSKLQAQDKKDLNRRQAGEFASARSAIHKRAGLARNTALTEYETGRKLIVSRQAREVEDLKAAWKERTGERQAAYSAFRAGKDLTLSLSAKFYEANGSGSDRPSGDGDSGLDAILEDLERERDFGLHDGGQDRDHDDDYDH
ncbi:MAG: relaxase/mobilization nuclease domain-containing protein [Pseudomonadota bacterium]